MVMHEYRSSSSLWTSSTGQIKSKKYVCRVSRMPPTLHMNYYFNELLMNQFRMACIKTIALEHVHIALFTINN
jgi:hypothetical protein